MRTTWGHASPLSNSVGIPRSGRSSPRRVHQVPETSCQLLAIFARHPRHRDAYQIEPGRIREADVVAEQADVVAIGHARPELAVLLDHDDRAVVADLAGAARAIAEQLALVEHQPPAEVDQQHLVEPAP